MVGGAIVRADLNRMHPQRRSELGRDRERAGRAAGDRRPSSSEAGACVCDRHQGVQRKRLVGREGIEPGRARAMADHRPGGDRGGSRCDLRVGHAQQHRVGSGGVGSATKRAEHGVARPTQGAREGVA